MLKKKPRFFGTFEPHRWLGKTSALFLAMVAGANALALWYKPLSDFRADVYKDPWGLPIMYTVWILGFFALELVRRKVRYDLDILQWERLTKGKVGR